MPDSYNAIPTSNSTYNEKHVASSAGTSLHCPIPCFMRWRRCTECFSWCRLHMPWVAKKGSPQVSTDSCCAISLAHSCVQKPENPPAIAPATMSAENIIQPKPDEGRFTFCNLSDVNVDLENSQCPSNKNRSYHGHREGGFNPVAVCSCSYPSPVSARGHWNCAEDNSSMRSSSYSTFEGCKPND